MKFQGRYFENERGENDMLTRERNAKEYINYFFLSLFLMKQASKQGNKQASSSRVSAVKQVPRAIGAAWLWALSAVTMSNDEGDGGQ